MTEKRLVLLGAFVKLRRATISFVMSKLIRNRQTQQRNKIGHELEGVLCKVRQDDMFRST